MAVMARDSWTNERLDDLNTKVDGGFGDLRTECRAIRADMQSEFQALRGEMGALRGEFSAFTRTVTQVLWAIVGTIFLGFMGTIAALVTLV